MTLGRRWIGAALLSVTVLLSACASSTTKAPEPAKSTTPAPAPTSAAPAAPEAAKPKELIPVSIGQSQDILAFAPLYVARAKGYFEEEGIKLTVEVLSGGTQVIQALSGGSVQFATTAAPDFLKAVLAKQDFFAVQSQIHQTMNIVISDKFQKKINLDRSAPIEKRIQALKGAMIGTTGPGAASETFPKWLIATYGNMNPEKDIETISIGGLPARQAALKSGQIDAYVSSGPGPEEAEAQGFGYVLFPAKEMPGSKGMLHEIVFGKREWVEKNQDTAARVARAITRGGKFLADNPAEGKKAVAQFFPKVDPKVLDFALDNIIGQIVTDGHFEAKQWDFLIEYLRAIGSLKAADNFDTKEGGFWSNKFAK